MVDETTGQWRILVISNALKIPGLEDAISLWNILSHALHIEGPLFTLGSPH